mmetsp:Transcript_157990/g.506732  ORF Transcript_157990/g.506732 Transcript_157990/m.506732 type:complete len:456 (-) Transcript_157990:52-1419(-)
MAETAVPTRTVSVQGKTTRTSYNVPVAWEPIKALGSGAYAAVASFRGPENSEFAIKKVDRVFDHPVLALRTLREVRLLAHFRHPNVLAITELFLEGPEFRDVYLCLEIMDGDLHQLVHTAKMPLSDYQVQCVLYQTVRGLLCLRRAHVLHRDLKPGNILVKAGGEVKIADLGLSRTIDAEDDCHEDAVLTEYVVTRYYRAPEVVLTATQYTYAVDMWSTGCILGEMLTRRPLFEGKDSLDQIRKIVSVMGNQSADEMSWIQRSSPSWKFVEKCNQTADGEAFQKILRWPKANPLSTDLLARMLRFDPSRRISVEDCLQHKYLEVFQPENDPEVAAARAVRPVDWSFDRELCFDEAGRPRSFDVRAFRSAFYKAARLAAGSSGGGTSSAIPSPRTPTRSPTTVATPNRSGEGVAASAAVPTQVSTGGHTAEARGQTPPRRWGRRWRENNGAEPTSG